MKKSIWILALVAFLGPCAFGQAQNDDVASYPKNCSLGYKGVLMANFDNADPQDELLIDFGDLGVWYYKGRPWRQESSLNPETMISVSTVNPSQAEAVLDFGTTGVWFWEAGSWTMLSAADAQGMFAVDDDADGKEEIQVDFGTLGVWRYDRQDSSWTQLSGLDPCCGLRTQVEGAGREGGCWGFPVVGVWVIYRSAADGTWNYQQLTGTVNSEDDYASAHFLEAVGAEDLVANFGSLGLWLCKGTDLSWVQISPMNVKRLKEVHFSADAVDELLAEDASGGLSWGKWNGTGFTWTLITNEAIGPHSAFCETFDWDGTDAGDEEVIIPLAGGGAYMFDYSEASQLSLFINAAYFINSIVKGDYYGKGRDSTLCVVFGEGSFQTGVWLYEKDSNPEYSGWIKLTFHIPDGNS